MITLINIYTALLLIVLAFVVVSSLQVNMNHFEYYLYLLTSGFAILFWRFCFFNNDRATFTQRHYRVSDTWLIIIFLIVFVFLFYSIGGINGLLRNWIAIHSEKTLSQKILFGLAANSYLFLVALLCFNLDQKFQVTKLFLLVFIAVMMLALTRTKSHLIPPILGLTFIFLNKASYTIAFKLWGMLMSACAAYAFYIGTTLIRWIGDLDDISVEKIQTTWNAVKASSIERNMGFQAVEVYKHYAVLGNYEYRSVINIFDPLLKFVTGYQIGNPMYHYSEILYGSSGALRGSAHPSIFIDGFANYGILGILQCLVVLSLVAVASRILVTKYSYLGLFYSVVFFGYALSLAARGSVYYGLLYVATGMISVVIFHLLLSALGGIKCLQTRKS